VQYNKVAATGADQDTRDPLRGQIGPDLQSPLPVERHNGMGFAVFVGHDEDLAVTPWRRAF
jgi:hypothetical protein